MIELTQFEFWLLVFNASLVGGLSIMAVWPKESIVWRLLAIAIAVLNAVAVMGRFYQ